MKLNIPYYSQYRDIKDKYWQKRACGLVCLKMILDFHQKSRCPTPTFLVDLDEFLEIALKKEAFGESGWIHEKLLALAESFGMQAYRKEKMQNEDELKDFLDKGNPVIVSIKAKRFSPKFENKFHQIVLTGYDESGFYYNDPDYQDEDPKPSETVTNSLEMNGQVGQGGKNLFVDKKTFQKYWRKMAIFVHSPV